MVKPTPQPAPPAIPVDVVKLADLDDYLCQRGLELAQVTLDCRHARMYIVARMRPRGTGGAVRVIQVGG